MEDKNTKGAVPTAPQVPSADAGKDKPLTVVATADGWYGNARISVGDKFSIKSKKDFAESWMTEV